MRLVLSLLGPLQATIDEEPVLGLHSKVGELLVYLAAEAERSHRRDALAALLWPDRSDQEALTSLRYALSNLRKSIRDREASPPFLLITRNTIQFNRSSNCNLDVLEFSRLAFGDGRPSNDMEQLKRAACLYQGEFLQSLPVAGSLLFDEWLTLKREQFNQQALTLFRQLTLYHEQVGDYELAHAYGQRQLELEPWSEEAHRQVMRLLALGGRHSAALAQYQLCRQRLMEELGVEPATETLSLYESIRDRRFSPPIGFTNLGKGDRLSGQVLTPQIFVGRENELAFLDENLTRVLDGRGRVAFITGEAGSGKTALIAEFARLAMKKHGDLLVVGGNCNAHTGVGDPYLPFREILQTLTGDIEAWRAGGTISRNLSQRLWDQVPSAIEALISFGPDLIDVLIERDALLARAETLSADSSYLATQCETLRELRSSAPAAGPRQVSLFEQVGKVLRQIAGQHPLMLVLDDLQWADTGSINLLFHLGRCLEKSPLFILGAYRPEDVASGRAGERHPLETVVHEIRRSQGDPEVDLAESEGKRFIDLLLDSEPNRLEKSFRGMLFQHTGGHPLFTVELLRGMQERGGLVKDQAGRWLVKEKLDWGHLPARVEAVIAERVNRLPVQHQALLAVACVEGETFTAELIARVQKTGEQEVISCLSGPLTQQGLARAVSVGRLPIGGQRLSRYRFRHALFQRYLFRRLDAVAQAHLHEAVGVELEELYRDGVQQIAPQLAWHFEAAGLTAKAVDYLLLAGKRAVRLLANKEAITHYTHALDLLNALPDTPDRAQKELELQLAIGVSFQILQSYGAPERGRAYARAYQLCQQIGDRGELFKTLFLQWSFETPQAKHRQALRLGEQLHDLAQQTREPAQAVMADMALGISKLYLGNLEQARIHLERAIAHYDPQRHSYLALPIGQDIRVSCKAYLSWALWMLGYPEQALQQVDESIALARALEHSFSLGFALGIASCVVCMRCGRYPQALEAAETLLKMWEEQSFTLYKAWGLCVKGRVLTEQGQIEAGIASMREGVAAGHSAGIVASHTQQLASFAVALRNAALVDEALEVVTDALALVQEHDEHHFEADLYLRQGELLMMQGETAAAESSLQQALQVARRQKAKSWELRASILKCDLYQRTGSAKLVDAKRELQVAYDWFTEGFETLDLQRASELLVRRNS